MDVSAVFLGHIVYPSPLASSRTRGQGKCGAFCNVVVGEKMSPGGGGLGVEMGWYIDGEEERVIIPGVGGGWF